MLPQLEQTPLYNTFNFSSLINNGLWNLQNAYNSTGQLTTVNVFICPSDINRLNMATNGFATANPGPNNYAANAGNTGLTLQATIFDQTVGPFPGNTAKCAKMANIIDGTSNTVAFSEIVKGVGAFAGNLDNLTPSATPVPIAAAASGVALTDYTNCKAGVPRTVSANSGGSRSAPAGGGADRARTGSPGSCPRTASVATSPRLIPTATTTRSRPVAATPGSPTAG